MNTPTHPPTPSHNRAPLQKLVAWIHRHHLSLAIILGASVVTSVFIVALLSVRGTTGNLPFFTPAKKTEPKVVHSRLTGLAIKDEAALRAPVTGVMIENSPNARPQSGLKQAGVVYEAVAEGGITRFLALYQHDHPSIIGPVRSLRLHYLHWAAPYQASIAHVGGSGNALSEVRNGNYRDLDEFRHSSTYWRATDRVMPHNAYTSGERLQAVNQSKEYTHSDFTGFARTDGKPAETPTATTVTVNLSGPLYNTHYVYDKANNRYARFMAGEPHHDREAGAITPSVVVVLESSAQHRTGSREGYEDLVTTGSGRAHIFQNGTATEATWKKASATDELQLVDTDGKAIALNRGQTWIAGTITGRGSVQWQ